MSKNNSVQPKECTLYIKGMHCPSCEVLIEKQLKKYDGVVASKASLSDKKVTITLKDPSYSPNIQKLNKDFSELGYTFSTNSAGKEGFNSSVFVKALFIAGAFVLAFSFLSKFEFIQQMSISSASSISAFFVFGLVAGMSSCAALVGGILLSLSEQWLHTYKAEGKKYVPFTLFNGGRLISFAILGGVLGLIGSLFKTSLETTALLTLTVAIVMILLGLQMLDVSWATRFKIRTPKFISGYITDESNFTGKYMPLLVGALTFFVPCGFTLIAQTAAVSTGSFWRSASIMLAFALGTLPVLLLISFTSVSMNSSKKWSTLFNYVAGLIVIFFGLYTVNSQLNVLGVFSMNDFLKETLAYSPNAPGTSKPETKVVSADAGSGNVQNIKIEAKGFEYNPRQLTLKAGVPVRMEILNDGAVGCARSMSARGLVPNAIYLKEGTTVVEFTPRSPGTYKITCSMGMVDPITVTVL